MTSLDRIMALAAPDLSVDTTNDGSVPPIDIGLIIQMIGTLSDDDLSDLDDAVDQEMDNRGIPDDDSDDDDDMDMSMMDDTK